MATTSDEITEARTARLERKADRLEREAKELRELLERLTPPPPRQRHLEIVKEEGDDA